MATDAAFSARTNMSWRGTISGLCACLIGIGLARFAYTPLIPALILHRWFAPAAADYLGAANLAGYLAGALAGRAMARAGGTNQVLRAMMLLATAAFFACAWPLSFLWYFVWRFASGLAGGALMVLAAPHVLAEVAPARRGLAGGIIFTGVGLGIAASGTLVPLLLRFGLLWTWIGLGAISLILSLIGWGGWPATRRGEGRTVQTSGSGATATLPVKALYLEYGLNAVGLVPHMVFLVDFVARGLGRGLAAGAAYWVIFGLGALVGPLAAGAIGDRIGFRAGLRLSFLVQAGAVAVLAVAPTAVGLGISCFIVGAFVPGIVPVTLGRIHDLLPGDTEGQKAAWSYATTAFALGQAAAAYGFSYLFAQGAAYGILFALAAAALLAALGCDLLVGLVRRPGLAGRTG